MLAAMTGAPPTEPSLAGRGERPLRADARRNRERVLRAAQQLFTNEGLGVSLDEIARHAGVGPGTVHRHFATKEALYLAVATDQIRELVAEAKELSGAEDPAAAFSAMLSRMITTGAGALKSALAGAELDLRTAAPVVAADLTRHVGVVLSRAQSVAVVRQDLTIEELMALVAGTLAAIRHANAETDHKRSAHLAQIMFDGLRPNPPQK
jgi:AcrR family transcriptional regulator